MGQGSDWRGNGAWMVGCIALSACGLAVLTKWLPLANGPSESGYVGGTLILLASSIALLRLAIALDVSRADR